MKLFKIIPILAAAAIAMAACNGDDEAAGNGLNDRAEVRFSGGTAEIQTRVSGSSWADGDPAGIYMIGAAGGLTAGNVIESAANRPYHAAAGTGSVAFTPAGDALYYPMSGDVKFIAYHPYTAAVNPTEFTLPVNVGTQAPQTAIDVLYAATGGSYNKNSASAVPLAFTHRLVKLAFSISAGDGVTEPLAGLTLKITGQQTATTLNLADGTLAAPSGTSADDVTAVTASDGKTSEAILLPNASVSGMTFVFTTTGGGAYEVAVPAPAATAGWEAGSRYVYTAVLKRNEVSISGAVGEWTATGNEYSVTGKLPQPPQIVYTSQDHTQQLYMLPYNLGVTDEVKLMTVDEQMAANMNLIAGSLFQWGRVADGHELRSSGTYSGPVTVSSSDGQVVEGTDGYGLFIPNTSSPYDWRSSYSPAKWEGASDPCSSVTDGGKAWRLPTSDEWKQITDYNSRETTAKGLRLKPDGTNVSVFLPAAGYRGRANGALGNVGSGGYYWSSSPSDTYAFYLTFGSSAVYPSEANGRSQGSSVRCVAEP
jgi:uncharacterized protein (TIGR02145 family)